MKKELLIKLCCLSDENLDVINEVIDYVSENNVVIIEDLKDLLNKEL